MNWNLKFSSLWQRLVVALLIIAIASALRAMLLSSLGRTIPYLLYYPAVTAAALFGGLPAGLLATFLSAGLSFFWIQQGATSPAESLALAIFVVSCAMISFVGEIIRHAHQQTKLAQEKAEAANQKLRGEAAEREQAKSALRESEERFRFLFEQAAVGMAQIRSDTGRFQRINQKYCDIVGYSRQELEQLDFPTITHPDDLPRDLAHMESLRSGKIRTYLAEKRYIRKDGSVVWVNLTVSCMWSPGEPPSSYVAVVDDITKRKMTEESLRATDRALKTISACNQAMVRATNEPELLQQVCEAIVEHGGYRMAWLGFARNDEKKSIDVAGSAGVESGYLEKADISWSETSERGRGPSGIAFRTGQMVVCNDFLNDPRTAPWRKAGAERGYAAMISVPLKNAGQSFGALSIYAGRINAFHDEEIKLLSRLADDLAFGINAMRTRAERRRAEEIILQERDFSQAALDSLPGLFYLFEARGRILRVNKNFEKLSGYSTDELSRMTLTQLFDGADRERVAAAIGQVLAMGEVTVEVDFPSKNRQTRTPFVFSGKLFNFERKLCVMGMGIDITKRKQLEEQLRQSQKMEAIGHLAGGVAHDFNNILAALLLQIDLLRLGKRLPEEIENSLKLIQADAERAANLVRQLLLFSRRQAMQPRDLDLNDVVTNFSKMLQRIIGEDIQMQLNLHASPLNLRADPGMIEQVLMNLAANARDAMPKGGRLLIEAKAATVSAEDARRFNAEAVPGLYACLSVSDTGTGIPPDVVPNIFEPFFTTKDVGKGTGLGLATVFGIAKQHKGWVEVDNRPGEGVTFLVYFPALAAGDKKPALAAPALQALGGTETILLVEDEGMLRDLARRLLQRSGYQVLVAVNGKEALALGREHLGSVALLLTDLIMPDGVSGLELAGQLVAEKPQLKVVYISGYSADVARAEFELHEGVNFVQKPFSAERLLQTIRQSLDRVP